MNCNAQSLEYFLRLAAAMQWTHAPDTPFYADHGCRAVEVLCGTDLAYSGQGLKFANGISIYETEAKLFEYMIN